MDKAPVRPTTASSVAAKPGVRPTRDSGDHHEVKLPTVPEDGLLKVLHAVIRFAVKVLAILMTLVIIWGIIDVFHVIFQRVLAHPYFLLTVTDILSIFGSVLTVLIAIEIFINITLYIKYDVLPIKIVIATALMAISRKVIMLDLKELDPIYIFAIAAAIVALGLTYFLITYKPAPIKHSEER